MRDARTGGLSFTPRKADFHESINGDDSTIITGKIAKLLDEETDAPVAYRGERHLTALVLLTRVPNNEQFHAVWEFPQHQATLVNFIQRLLSLEDRQPENNYRASEKNVYIRLVAKLLSRMDPDRLLDTVIDPLGSILLQAWLLTEYDSSQAIVDVEVLTSLTAWLSSSDLPEQQQKDVNVVDKFLLQIWKRYHQTAIGTSFASSRPVVGSSPSCKDQQKETIPLSPPQQLMMQTLTAILDQDTDVKDNESNLQEHLESLVTVLFLKQGLYCIEKGQEPSFWMSAMKWWLGIERQSKSRTKNYSGDEVEKKDRERCSKAMGYRQSWAELLLLLASRMVAVSPKTLKPILVLGNANDGGASSYLLQLLLASVVSVELDSDQLRIAAWSTLAVLVDSCGWKWLMRNQHQGKERQEDASKTVTALGRAADICTLIRLAVGEWRIQLSWLVDVSSTTMQDGVRGGGDRLVLIKACADVLVEAINFIVLLADQVGDGAPDDDDKVTQTSPSSSLPLTVDAVLHLRHSLIEALNNTIECFCLVEQPRQSLPRSYASAVRVLGVFLTELDVFEAHQQYELPAINDNVNQDKESNRIGVLLEVLATAMRLETKSTDVVGRNDDLVVVARFCVLPALLSLFVCSQGDPARVSLLKEADLLGDTILDFLQACWVDATIETSNLETIQCASQVADLWNSFVADTNQYGALIYTDDKQSKLSRAIIEWIRRLLGAIMPQQSKQPPGNENVQLIVSTLSSAVSSYMLLNGDEAKTDQDGDSLSILQHAFEFCAKFNNEHDATSTFRAGA